MTEKQERIHDAMRTRISQLEDELNVTKERLYNLLDQKEEMEKDMENLRAEAHDVVGQWEKETTEVRKKLETSETQQKNFATMNKEKDEKITSLEEELKAAENVASVYSNSIQELQKEKKALQHSRDSFEQRAADTERGWIEMSDRIKEYEILTQHMQKEIKESFSQHKNDVTDLEELRLTLTQVMEENASLRTDFTDMSRQAQTLVDETEKLQRDCERMRKEHEALSKQHRELETEMSEKVKQLLAEQDKAQEVDKKLEEVTHIVQEVTSEKADIEAKLSSAQTASQQQFEVIEALEKELRGMRESRDGDSLYTEELKRKIASQQAEITVLQTRNDGLQAEFEAVKECYSTLLVESNDTKSRNDEVVANLTDELNALRFEFNEKLILTEHKYVAAMCSINQLTESIMNREVRHFFQEEATLRRDIELLFFKERIAGVQDNLWPALVLEIKKSAAVAESVSVNFSAATAEICVLKSKSNEVELKCKDSERQVDKYRKSCATLESKLANELSEKAGLSTKCGGLENDNDWLKGQVDVMRQELGDLDEILNANLNEMREENEKRVVENETLKKQIQQHRNDISVKEDQIAKLHEAVETLENELRAQGKTLSLTDSDLRDLTQEVERLHSALATNAEKLRTTESRLDEVQNAHNSTVSDASRMKDTIQHLEMKLRLISADRRAEVENLRIKVNEYVEKAEQLESQLSSRNEDLEGTERALAVHKENATKMRNVIDELKARCASDAESIKQLLVERDELVKDRDVIVEKYNKLHDAFRGVRKEVTGKTAEELKRLLNLCTTQESELQQIRSENSLLKRSVSMFVTTAQPKAEAIFVERLNLTEGPLRHPKKRSVANAEQ